MEGALTLSWRDMGRTAGILCAASLVGLLFYKAGITEANIVTVYLLAVLCTALATDVRHFCGCCKRAGFQLSVYRAALYA